MVWAAMELLCMLHDEGAVPRRVVWVSVSELCCVRLPRLPVLRTVLPLYV